jgi:hypothetical protein
MALWLSLTRTLRVSNGQKMQLTAPPGLTLAFDRALVCRSDLHTITITREAMTNIAVLFQRGIR